MPKTLSIGSFGPEVRELQTFLNLLPSLLPRLVADSSFGPKTKNRSVEFQKQSFLSPDGVVGPITWGKLLALIAQIVPGSVPPGTIPGTVPNMEQRAEVVRVARMEAEAAVVAAKLPGGIDPANTRTLRLGHDRLLKYFRLSAPNPGVPDTTFFNEDAIKYLITPGQLAPMPHWCGIFALWCLKTANLQVGNWKMGFGISSVSGIKQIIPKTKAMKGDVGYVNNGFEHHFIIEEVFQEGGKTKMRTIEGNSDPSSNFNFKTRTMDEVHSVYSPF